MARTEKSVKFEWRTLPDIENDANGNDRQGAKLYISIFFNLRYCEIYDVISMQINTISSSLQLCTLTAIAYVG